MATNNNRLRVSELDFEEIKSNLKDFLRGQDTFSDYDYEGSGLSVLIDVLAYNTHYNAVLANMQINEKFIDSAVARSSVVSIAKHYDYYPSSYSSSTARVNITVNTADYPNIIVLPKNTVFSAVLNGKTYSFVTNDTYTTSIVAGVYKFLDIPLYEGKLKTSSFVVDTRIAAQKYVIPEYNVDISKLKVYVKPSITSSVIEPYYESKDISNINGESNTFFIQGSLDNKYEIYFGDGILGKALSDGNVIILEYIVCSGDTINGSSIFTADSTISGYKNVAIQTISPSSGGRNFEDIDSIRTNALKSYTTQNRMVTTEDYRTLIPTIYPNIKSLNIWGGDENVPPDYGSVYISIEPNNIGTLSDIEKQNVINLVKNKNILGIRPKIIDPTYIYIDINSTVYFDPNRSKYNANELSTLVKNTIILYNNIELMKFNGIFRYSKLSASIDNIDSGILSNITTFKLHQYLVPVYGKELKYIVQFNNPIYQNTFKTAENAVSSSGFRIFDDPRIYYLEDDGDQYIKMYYFSDITKLYVNNAGTIDYLTGIITLTLNIASFLPENVGDTGIKISIESQSFDVVPVRNNILVIKDSNIVANAIADEIVGGYNVTGTQRVFTTSR